MTSPGAAARASGIQPAGRKARRIIAISATWVANWRKPNNMPTPYALYRSTRMEDLSHPTSACALLTQL